MRNSGSFPVVAGPAIAGTAVAVIIWFYPYWSHRAASADAEGKQYHCDGLDFSYCKVVTTHTHYTSEVLVPTAACGVAAFIVLFIVLRMAWAALERGR